MSFSALAQISSAKAEIRKLGVTSSELLVLLALADRKNETTGRCFPSMKVIAADTFLGERTVRDAVAALRSKGLIKTLDDNRQEVATRTGSSYEFVLTIPPVGSAAIADVGGIGSHCLSTSAAIAYGDRQPLPMGSAAIAYKPRSNQEMNPELNHEQVESVSSHAGAVPPAPPAVLPAETDSPAPAQEAEPESTPARTSKPAPKTHKQKLEDRFKNKGKAAVPVSSQSTPAPSEEFNALDFVFMLPRDGEWQGISVPRLRRVLWHHLRTSTNRYWVTQGDLTSEERLARAIKTMDAQATKFEESRKQPISLPGWTTATIKKPVASCSKCGGTGVLASRPHPDYPARFHFSSAAACDCPAPIPKPWWEPIPAAA